MLLGVRRKVHGGCSVPSCHSMVWWADSPVGHIGAISATSTSSGDVGHSIMMSYLEAHEHSETQSDESKAEDSWILLMVQLGA